MKRLLLGFLIIVALSLGCAGTALAVPVGPVEGISGFAEYDMDWYDSFILGVGYGVSENLTIGIFCPLEWECLGAYANLALGPVRVNGELIFDEWCIDGMVSGLYTFNLKPVTLGVGGGFDFCLDGSNFDFFVDVTAEVALDSLTVYGGFMYYPEDGWTSIKIGVVYAF